MLECETVLFFNLRYCDIKLNRVASVIYKVVSRVQRWPRFVGNKDIICEIICVDCLGCLQPKKLIFKVKRYVSIRTKSLELNNNFFKAPLNKKTSNVFKQS
jgi:hypothetical protein